MSPPEALAPSYNMDDAAALIGIIECRKGIMLLVDNWFEARHFGSTLRVRGRSFRYVAWIPGEHLLLKYHNHHLNPNEYIHRVYHPATGEELLYETLHRYQFPTYEEVLDELETLAEGG